MYVNGDRCKTFSKKMGIKESSITLLLHKAKIVKRVDGDLNKIINKVNEVLAELK